MHITFRTFTSRDGDCLFLTLTDNDEKFVIMTDCGSFEETIEKYVREDCNSHINLLIVTHIDRDHICGLTKMINDVANLSIDKIIYNSYKRKSGPKRKLTKKEKEWLDSIRPEIQPVAIDVIEHGISAEQAIELASAILSKSQLKGKWEPDVRLHKGCSISFDKWGIIKFVSPEENDIEALDEVFYETFYKLLYFDAAKVSLNKGESIYELILRYVDAYHQEEQETNISFDNFSAEEIIQYAKKPSPTNGITPSNNASLAYVWESSDKKHRILILGDSNPDTVVKGLLDVYPDERRPLIMDAIKVSHHGSHYNTTNELMRQVDSRHFFFTGGAEGVRPHENTIAKIISSPVSDVIKCRTLHFNFMTSLIENIKNNHKLQKEYHFECDTTKNIYEFDI